MRTSISRREGNNRAVAACGCTRLAGILSITTSILINHLRPPLPPSHHYTPRAALNTVTMAPAQPELKKYIDKRLFVQLNGSRKVIGVLRGYDVSSDFCAHFPFCRAW
jgi:LSM domain